MWPKCRKTYRRERKNLQEGHLDQIWGFLGIACLYHSFLRKPGLSIADLNFPLSNCGKLRLPTLAPWTASFTLHSFEQGSRIIIILTGYYHPYFKGAMNLFAFPDNLITLGSKFRPYLPMHRHFSLNHGFLRPSVPPFYAYQPKVVSFYRIFRVPSDPPLIHMYIFLPLFAS